MEQGRTYPSSGCYVLWLVWGQLSSPVSSSPFSWAHLPNPSLTPPTQLPAPVVPGESGGRHDEGGAIVLADVISPVEQRMDDEKEVDPMNYINTNTYDCDIDMMSQPYDESGYQHANEETHRVDLRLIIHYLFYRTDYIS